MSTNWSRKNSQIKNEHSTTKIDDFPKMFSGKIIKIILQEEKETQCKYSYGNFHINYEDDRHYSCSYELYFQDDKNEIYKTANKTKPLSNASLVPEARKELAEEKVITFEIPEPSEAERDVYGSNFSPKDLLKKLFSTKR